ncbi:MAG: protein tlpB [Bacteroidia bacterium]|nr:MAG: protein tlpB [Bacteroidia bacterium]
MQAKIKHSLLTFLNIILGLIFIYSAYSKLYPIEPFELTFVELKIANWYTAPFIARFLISVEFFIGLMLISNLKVKFSSKLAIAVLFLFCIYLTAILMFQGNTGNCGCFGTRIIMTPLQALIKNILMIGLLLVIYFFHNGFDWNKSKYFILLNALSSLALPHILNYVELSYSEHYLVKKEDIYPLELDTLFKYAKIHQPPQELKKGKHIIAFMSLTCPHCRIAAKKMRLMKERNPNLPFYFVLNGEEADLQKFFNDTKATNIPYCMLLGKPFVYLAGLNLPSIYLVQNDTVISRVNYIALQQNEIEKWLNNTSSKTK